jgi:hypothetical protein
MLAKVAGKDTRTVVNALIKQSKKLPKELYKSLTWDRGKELTIIGALRWPPTSMSILRPAKPMAARVEREYQWPAETVLSKGHRLVGAFASPSEQSGSSAKRTTT